MTAIVATEPKSGFGLWIGISLLGALMLVPLSTAWSLAPDLGHGWAAVILMGYIWWERWEQRPALNPVSPGWIGWGLLVLCSVAALPLRLMLTPYPLWPAVLLLYLGLLVVFLLYAAWLMGGKAAMRWVAGPLIILIGVVPWPGVIDRWLILPLREGVAMVVAEISNLSGHPAVAAGTSVQLAGGWVGIDEACGGIRSLQAAVTTALFFGVWLRLRWPRRAALLGVAVLAAVGGNFLRVLFLSWLAAGRGESLNTWHDPAGWLALGLTLAVTGWVGWSWRRLEPAAPLGGHAAAAIPGKTRKGVGAVLPWMAVMLVVLVGGEIGTRLWYAQGAAEVEKVPQWSVRLPSDKVTFRAQPLAKSAQEMLRPDRFESGSWMGPDLLLRSAYSIEWHRGQVARSVPFLHNPTVCLPYAGCELVRELGVLSVRWAGGEIPFHAYVFRRMDEDMLVAFAIWDPARGRELADMEGSWVAWWQNQWRDVREAREHQPAQLFAYAIVGGASEHAMADELAALILPANEP